MSNTWNASAPGWEGGENCEFLMADGTIVAGKFDMEDSVFDGESSYPIWYVELADCRRMSFYANEIKGWRIKSRPDRDSE